MNLGLNFNHEITNRTDSAVNLFKYNSKTLSLFFEPEIGIEHHKPAGLQWQQNGSVSIRIPYFFTRQNSRVETPTSVSAYKNVFSAPQFILNSFYGFGYYPNNRTIINAGLNFQAIFGELYAGIVNRDYYILSPGAQLNADYFINFRTRLFLSASLNYRYTGFRDQYPSFMVVDKNVLFGNFNFGLSHFIF